MNAQNVDENMCSITILSSKWSKVIAKVSCRDANIVVKVLRTSSSMEAQYIADLISRIPSSRYVAKPICRALSSALICVRRYLETTLDAWINTEEASLPILCKLLMDIVLGLKAIHSVGLIHCDIKPSNIGVDRRDTKILDLESLTPVYSKPREIDLNYAAPEYLSSGRVLRESDLYQLGLTIFECIDKLYRSDYSTINIYSSLHDLAQRLTDPNPFARPTHREILDVLAKIVDRYHYA